MKNLELYKRGVALLSAAVISLSLTGCNKSEGDGEVENKATSVSEEET